MISIHLLAVIVGCQDLLIFGREILSRFGMSVEFDLTYSKSEYVLITNLQRGSTFRHQIYCEFAVGQS